MTEDEKKNIDDYMNFIADFLKQNEEFGFECFMGKRSIHEHPEVREKYAYYNIEKILHDNKDLKESIT